MVLICYKTKTDDLSRLFLEKARTFGEVREILPKCILVDTEVDASKIAESFPSILSRYGYFLVTEVTADNLYGLVGASVAQWIKNKCNKNK
jgi:hypothetical protein